MSYPNEVKAAETLSKSVSTDNFILFDALECKISGNFASISFGPWTAVSGAGLNSNLKMDGTKLSTWLPDKAVIKKHGKQAGQRGGVIPPGWWIVTPEILAHKQTSKYVGIGSAPTNDSLKLVPFQLEYPDPSLFGECNRGGFYIHGASKDASKEGSGSDGCILMAPDDRKWLADRVLGGSGAWLYVYLNCGRIKNMMEAQLALKSIA